MNCCFLFVMFQVLLHVYTFHTLSDFTKSFVVVGGRSNVGYEYITLGNVGDVRGVVDVVSIFPDSPWQHQYRLRGFQLLHSGKFLLTQEANDSHIG